MRAWGGGEAIALACGERGPGEHAGQLLLTDAGSGAWPAAPFLEHLAHAATVSARLLRESQ
ncbi:hypothetical protein OG233_01495 [Streptomyces sp. NBC_01218]|uniref:hypothetical protein n=1 Tax=Streptomyces sp. NBC_01218 TaxID=2903780 RepID=UPI002E0DA74E|nr:hypothetical protein OG233_01495 [Streptomyces sp. NBC_01218]